MPSQAVLIVQKIGMALKKRKRERGDGRGRANNVNLTCDLNPRGQGRYVASSWPSSPPHPSRGTVVAYNRPQADVGEGGSCE
eukprot:scaffold17_cov354-Pavlova_lutheri.AAC.33